MGSTVDLVTLRNLIRLECGNVGPDDLPDSVIESKIRMTSQRVTGTISSKSSDTKLGSIPTVAGQQAYPIPEGQEVDEVFWTGVTETFRPDVGIVGQVPQNAQGEGYGAYWRSDYLMQEIRANQIDFQYGWEILDGKIWLDPIPSASGLLIFYTFFEISSVSEELPFKYERSLLLGASADVFRFLANRFRNRSIPLRNAGIQEFNKTTEFEEKAKIYDDLFNDELLRVSVGV